jgi:hypothetical protein
MRATFLFVMFKRYEARMSLDDSVAGITDWITSRCMEGRCPAVMQKEVLTVMSSRSGRGNVVVA